MEKIIQTLINSWTKGVDTYTHNGSTWLIFTDNKQWVIELTDSKTLWYNYNFFKQIFEFTSLDVVENQSHITQWVEDNIINKVSDICFRDTRDNKHQFEDTLENGVNHTSSYPFNKTRLIEDALENGVKETSHNATMFQSMKVEDTIQNGIKETRLEMNITEGEVDDIIQDGVKHTARNNACADWEIEDTIQNGVKETDYKCLLKRGEIEDIIDGGVIYTFGDNHHKHHFVDNVIQNGVRDTQSNPYENESWIEGVIKKGVKLTLNTEYMPTSMVEDIIQSGVRKTLWISVERESLVEKTINNGVKETNPVDVMKFFDNKMEDALQNGVKETNYDTDNYTDDVKEVIREGVKSSIPRQYVINQIIDDTINYGVKNIMPGSPNHFGLEDTIQNGVKETHDDVYHHKGRIDGVIKNGIKETKTPGNGDIVAYVEWIKENKADGYPKMIDDVIDNGEKINGTYAGGQRQSIKCKSVVEYGTKNPTD